MISNPEEMALLHYVDREINSGKRRIIIPPELMKNVREEAFSEIIKLCKLNGVEIEIID